MRIVLVAFVIAGCGGSPSEPVDAAVVVDATAYPAPHPAAPQLVGGGGPMLPAATIVPITFPDDPYVADIEKFAATLGASSYWTAIAAPYGIGAIGSTTGIHMAEAAPDQTDMATIRSWLAGQLDGTHADWGAPDPNKIYAVFYPKTTQIMLPGAGLTCIDNAGGFHDSVTVGAIEVTYSVVVECDAGLDGSTKLDALTLGASHEWIEDVTDPFGSGLYVDPNDYAVLPFAASGEIADLCEFTDVWFKPDDLGYAVTRAWSNAAASAGHAPCVPAIAAPYFNSAPVLHDTVGLHYAGYTFATDGVTIPVGGTATIELDLFSDAPTSDAWRVSAMDIEAVDGHPPVLAFTFDRATGRNGDKLALTIQVLATDPNYGAEPFVIESQLGTTLHTWFAIVGN